MIKMKTIFTGCMLAATAFATLTGCKKFLDRQPLAVTSNDLQVGELNGAALGLYGAIRNSASDPYLGDGFENIPWVAMNGFRSDDAEIVADPGASAWHQTYDLFQYTKDDWGAGLYWDKHFVLVGLCNDIIDKAETENLNSPADLVNVAEAKFFRAYSYFDLVRTFGKVPKIDFKINDITEGQIEKSDTSEIYNLIKADLTFAEQYLPINWEEKYKGRLTSDAAKSLHGKVLLQQHLYAEALPLLRDVIESNRYTLVDEYYKIYKTSGELGSESIFEIQASKSAGDGNVYWSRLGQCQGVRGGSGEWDLGWGWNTPTADLVNSYEVGDKRKSATILFSGQPDGGESTGGYGQTLPNLSNALYWNKKVYNKYSDYLAAGLGTPNNEAQNTWINHRVLRLGDVLLMGAEAANEVGGAQNTADAETWVNKIRTRAALSPVSYTTQAAFRTVIKKERRAELAMDYDRFFDLVRWNDAITVLGPLGYQNKHRFYPIPTSALNANPNLTQNPEWP